MLVQDNVDMKESTTWAMVAVLILGMCAAIGFDNHNTPRVDVEEIE